MICVFCGSAELNLERETINVDVEVPIAAIAAVTVPVTRLRCVSCNATQLTQAQTLDLQTSVKKAKHELGLALLTEYKDTEYA